MKHCCKEMIEFIRDERLPIKYSPIYRDYFLPVNNSYDVIQCVFFCPWCGTKLPESLRLQWYDILENEYNIEPCIDVSNDKSIPEEFKSDAWWKKREL